MPRPGRAHAGDRDQEVQLPDPQAVGAALVAVRNGTPVRLRDVAQITFAPALRSGDALIMGRPGILLVVGGVVLLNLSSAAHG